MRKKLVAGNWKMHGSLESNAGLLQAIVQGLAANPVACDVLVCPPALYVAPVASRLTGTPVQVGVQDVSVHEAGAYTGEWSAAMVRDLGVRYAIVGHSERRKYHAESDNDVALKVQQALSHGVTPIVCVGETLEQREAGQTMEVVKRQLAAVIHHNKHCISEVVVAYEPVWAIGTGKTATPEQAQEVHAVLRAQLAAATVAADKVRILYGGSVNMGNAAALFALPDVDGALVGGASLKAQDFLSIAAAA